MIKELLPTDWQDLLRDELSQPYVADLEAFVEEEYRTAQIFPPQQQLLRAFEWCSVADLKVVIIGQDPYHDVGQANGLCFSVGDGVALPPSLRNIFKEVSQQCGCGTPSSGNLEHWARQGVLLLNSVLSVRAHEPASHAGRGWERFTDGVVEALARNCSGVVYMLWGNYAKSKGAIVEALSSDNCILYAAHPSPLSFRHRVNDAPQFLAANTYLTSCGRRPIDWPLPAALTLF